MPICTPNRYMKWIGASSHWLGVACSVYKAKSGKYFNVKILQKRVSRPAHDENVIYVLPSLDLENALSENENYCYGLKPETTVVTLREFQTLFRPDEFCILPRDIHRKIDGMNFRPAVIPTSRSAYVKESRSIQIT